jgi:hypothetical protein
MATYTNTSPWANTPIERGYLDYFRIRPVSAELDDPIYVIESQYTYRPDLLAHDIYGNSKLWWVFAQRNMDVIVDPIYDFVAGVSIRLPNKTNLFKVLGL